MPHQNNRDSWLERLRGLIPKRHLMAVDLAGTLAKHAHRYATGRKPSDDRIYVRRRASVIIVDEAGARDITAVIATLLFEAAADGRDVVDVSKLKSIFGPDVTLVLEKLAKRRLRNESLLENGDWRYLMVKAAELLEDLRSLKHLDESQIRIRIGEIREQYVRVFEHLDRLIPKKYVRGARLIRDTITALIIDYDERLRTKV